MAFIDSYHIGISIGARREPTALAVVEEPVWLASDAAAWGMGLPPLGTGWLSPGALPSPVVEALRAHNYHTGRPAQPPLSVRHLERFPLGTRYPAIVARVAALLQSPPLAGVATLIVDGTAVGGPVVDQFRLALGGLVEVTIVGGAAVNRDEDGRYRVPKLHLADTVQALLQADRLRIARELPEAATLIDELLGYRLTTAEAANDRYEGRHGAGDDLVLATAVACWYREWYSTHLDATNARAADGRADDEDAAMSGVLRAGAAPPPGWNEIRFFLPDDG